MSGAWQTEKYPFSGHIQKHLNINTGLPWGLQFQTGFGFWMVECAQVLIAFRFQMV